MRGVRADDGRHYVLLTAGDEESLVRDPTTGERRRVATASITPVDGASPLLEAASAADEGPAAQLAAVPDERALGLLVELDAAGPQSVRSLLSYDLCESDLNGIVAELQAAGLLESTEIAGERGYALTGDAAAALEALTV